MEHKRSIAHILTKKNFLFVQPICGFLFQKFVEFRDNKFANIVKVSFVKFSIIPIGETMNFSPHNCSDYNPTLFSNSV